MNIRDYRINIPTGESGDWSVRKFDVSKEEAEIDALRAAFRDGRFVPQGSYTGLFRKGRVIMSDTPDEMGDLSCIKKYSGHVLVAGLGLGCAVGYGLAHTEIEKITVIEKSPDVISLTGPYWKEVFGDKLTIIEADIFQWKPTEVFDYGWFDIWDDLCTDNLAEFDKLLSSYGEFIRHESNFWGERVIRMNSRIRLRYCEECGEDLHWCYCMDDE